jgi:hypothetical protein
MVSVVCACASSQSRLSWRRHPLLLLVEVVAKAGKPPEALMVVARSSCPFLSHLPLHRLLHRLPLYRLLQRLPSLTLPMATPWCPCPR